MAAVDVVETVSNVNGGGGTSYDFTEDQQNILNQLTDMFIDIIEFNLILSVVQSRNWDKMLAVEDLMLMAEGCDPSDDYLQRRNKDNSLSDLVGSYTDLMGASSHSSKYDRNDAGSDNECISDEEDDDVAIEDIEEYSQSSSASFNNTSDVTDRTSKSYLEACRSAASSSVILPSVSANSSSAFKAGFVSYERMKRTRDSIERVRLYAKEKIKVMVILRGCPGSGKSYLAKVLVDTCFNGENYYYYVHSADHYFVLTNGGKYVFNPDLLTDAHSWNAHNVSLAIKDNLTPIIVDNTSTQMWEMRNYAIMAVNAGYDIEIIEPNTAWMFNLKELTRRNSHCVPKEKIKTMLERYEHDITPLYLQRTLRLQYTESKRPPQPGTTEPKDKNLILTARDLALLTTSEYQSLQKKQKKKNKKAKLRSKKLESTEIIPPVVGGDDNARGVVTASEKVAGKTVAKKAGVKNARQPSSAEEEELRKIEEKFKRTPANGNAEFVNGIVKAFFSNYLATSEYDNSNLTTNNRTRSAENVATTSLENIKIDSDDDSGNDEVDEDEDNDDENGTMQEENNNSDEDTDSDQEVSKNARVKNMAVQRDLLKFATNQESFKRAHFSGSSLETDSDSNDEKLPSTADGDDNNDLIEFSDEETNLIDIDNPNGLLLSDTEINKSLNDDSSKLSAVEGVPSNATIEVDLALNSNISVKKNQNYDTTNKDHLWSSNRNDGSLAASASYSYKDINIPSHIRSTSIPETVSTNSSERDNVGVSNAVSAMSTEFVDYIRNNIKDPNKSVDYIKNVINTDRNVATTQPSDVYGSLSPGMVVWKRSSVGSDTSECDMNLAKYLAEDICSKNTYPESTDQSCDFKNNNTSRLSDKDINEFGFANMIHKDVKGGIKSANKSVLDVSAKYGECNIFTDQDGRMVKSNVNSYMNMPAEQMSLLEMDFNCTSSNIPSDNDEASKILTTIDYSIDANTNIDRDVSRFINNILNGSNFDNERNLIRDKTSNVSAGYRNNFENSSATPKTKNEPCSSQMKHPSLIEFANADENEITPKMHRQKNACLTKNEFQIQPKENKSKKVENNKFTADRNDIWEQWKRSVDISETDNNKNVENGGLHISPSVFANMRKEYESLRMNYKKDEHHGNDNTSNINTMYKNFQSPEKVSDKFNTTATVSDIDLISTKFENKNRDITSLENWGSHFDTAGHVTNNFSSNNDTSTSLGALKKTQFTTSNTVNADLLSADKKINEDVTLAKHVVKKSSSKISNILDTSRCTTEAQKFAFSDFVEYQPLIEDANSSIEKPKPIRKPVKNKPLQIENITKNKVNDNNVEWNPKSKEELDWKTDDTNNASNVSDLETLCSYLQKNNSTISTHDKGINTSYKDIFPHNGDDTNILIGHCREINNINDFPADSSNLIQITKKLTINKSTMTEENECVCKIKPTLEQLKGVFPVQTAETLHDLFDKCGGNIDWIVGMLCESGQAVLADQFNLFVSLQNKTSEANICEETARRTKKKKFRKIKPLKENVDTCNSNSEKLNENQNKDDANQSNKCDLSINTVDVLEPFDVSGVDNEENEKDHSIEIFFDSTLVHQLVDKFGNPTVLNVKDYQPIVRLPLSLAQQLHAHLVESIITQREENEGLLCQFVEGGDKTSVLESCQNEYDVETPAKLEDIIEMEKSLYDTKQESDKTTGNFDDYDTFQLSLQSLMDSFPSLSMPEIADTFITLNCNYQETANMLREEATEMFTIFDSKKVEDRENYLLQQAKEVKGNTRSPDMFSTKLSFSLLLESFPQMNTNVVYNTFKRNKFDYHTTLNILREHCTSMPSADSGCENKMDVLDDDQRSECSDIFNTHNFKRSEIEKEVESCRRDATEYYRQWENCTEKMKEATQKKNYKVASYYRELIQVHKERYELENSMAASLLINTSQKSSSNLIDLHYFKVTEAVQALDLFLDHHINRLFSCGSGARTQLFVIIGQGKRSIDGKSHLKGPIFSRLRKRKLNFHKEEHNPGMILTKVRKNSPLSYEV